MSADDVSIFQMLIGWLVCQNRAVSNNGVHWERTNCEKKTSKIKKYRMKTETWLQWTLFIGFHTQFVTQTAFTTSFVHCLHLTSALTSSPEQSGQQTYHLRWTISPTLLTLTDTNKKMKLLFFKISFHLLMIHSFNVIPHQQLCFLKSSYFQIIMRYKFRIKNSSEKEEQ